ncbi:MAG: hypothetical protein JNL66_18195 [Alphaproteobacteria bacterium]|nr:hypothetical protein [Alphaproteobacteria bacterium]
MIGAIGTFFQVAGQIGQAIHAVKQAIDGDGDDSQTAAGASERAAAMNATSAQRVAGATIARADGRVATRRDAAGPADESFADILSAVAARNAAAVNAAAFGTDRMAAQTRGAAAAAGRIDISI